MALNQLQSVFADSDTDCDTRIFTVDMLLDNEKPHRGFLALYAQETLAIKLDHLDVEGKHRQAAGDLIDTCKSSLSIAHWLHDLPAPTSRKSALEDIAKPLLLLELADTVVHAHASVLRQLVWRTLVRKVKDP